MGYNIEVSFNVLKNGSVTKLLEHVKNCAEKYFCEDFHEDYEFENKVQFQRRHCLINISFSQSNINNMIEFLNIIRNNHGLYIELIFDEKTNTILYASQYFITQKMDKYIAKKFKTEKRDRSYSDDENMILQAVSKQTKDR
jgi:hypothetical protein